MPRLALLQFAMAAAVHQLLCWRECNRLIDLSVFMPYGICHLSVVPVRILADHASEMLTQLLYGDHFRITDTRKHWTKIQIGFDKSEGWIGTRQFVSIDKAQYKNIERINKPKFSSDLVAFASGSNETLIPILMGSSISSTKLFSHKFEGAFLNGSGQKSNLVATAMYYLNAPFLWGGKTPFGIDDGGLSQMVYRINGYNLPRHAYEQSKEGESLSFIEESEPGDLAFFDDKEGNIDHVGIIMKDNFIIHAHGNVRVDRLDHTGIFNVEDRTYSHSLRVIKKIV
ncbi:MAG: NlpC/P60 family protein [Flavobacteriaceae bacterium]